MSFVLFIALAIAFFQQITGINAIFYYLPTIFTQAGGGTNAAFKQAVLVGLVNLGMTFVAIRFVDRLGRKPLLAIGATGMAISLLTCSWAFHAANYQLTEKSFVILQENKVPADLITDLKNSEKNVFTTDKEFIASLETKFGADRLKPYHDSLITAGLNIRASLVLFAIIGFVASFAISLGPVMWVLLSEIFPNQYRGMAISARRLLECGGQRQRHIYFPLGVVALWLGRNFFGLRTDGRRGFDFHSLVHPGNQRQDAGGTGRHPDAKRIRPATGCPSEFNHKTRFIMKPERSPAQRSVHAGNNSNFLSNVCLEMWRECDGGGSDGVFRGVRLGNAGDGRVGGGHTGQSGSA